MNENLIYSIALSLVSAPSLLNIWEDLKKESPRGVCAALENSRKFKTQEFITKKYSSHPLKAAEEIAAQCEKKSVDIITLWDRGYPRLLAEIKKPPLVLYVRGNINHERAVSIVGTRKTDHHASRSARKISTELSDYGFAIVSGMAVGIDREAHLGALQLERPTVGVLANGIDIIYPSRNSDIHSAILSSEKSALISEYPPGIIAGKWTFVRRNRIISGLSSGTVIVKAGRKSGALITASYALEQNREIFACPGPVFDEGYEGCHRLIRDGALLVSSTEDILNELKFCGADENSTGDMPVQKEQGVTNPVSRESDLLRDISPDSMEGRIAELLKKGRREIDSLIRELNASTSSTNETLCLMELTGLISREGNMVSLIK